jgi:two-component system sensor histidine kinase/response regulator
MGLKFDLEMDAGLQPYLRGDAGKLRQVLINLLGNAVRYTEEGTVWLRARSQPQAGDPSVVSLQLEVEDTGPGIASEQLDHIFKAFVQGEAARNGERGTGLGLAVAKELVEMMGGEIMVASELGQGSLFRVTVPMQLAEAGVAAPGEARPPDVVGLPEGQPAWRILVVDDSLENRSLLTTLLSRVGFTVQQAKDGKEAIAVFEDWSPHLIWMDMRMPVMDGYEATRRIRALPGGDAVKIAAVTASAFEEQREEILASGCDDMVRKPFREHKVFETMAQHLDVEYVYEQAAGEEPERAPRVHLTAEMLANLPPELRKELEETTLALNREATLQVIGRIEEQAPDTARALRLLVEEFQMGRIRKLLEETEEGDG